MLFGLVQQKVVYEQVGRVETACRSRNPLAHHQLDGSGLGTAQRSRMVSVHCGSLRLASAPGGHCWPRIADFNGKSGGRGTGEHESVGKAALLFLDRQEQVRRQLLAAIEKHCEVWSASA